VVDAVGMERVRLQDKGTDKGYQHCAEPTHDATRVYTKSITIVYLYLRVEVE
jgi:hypothetical protein